VKAGLADSTVLGPDSIGGNADRTAVLEELADECHLAHPSFEFIEEHVIDLEALGGDFDREIARLLKRLANADSVVLVHGAYLLVVDVLG
jgi:hypothetical protein